MFHDGKIRVAVTRRLCDYGSRKSIIYVHVYNKQNKTIICLLYVFIYISVMKTTATPETAI